jgi:transcriptional regulator with XRE-family HTH domain
MEQNVKKVRDKGFDFVYILVNKNSKKRAKPTLTTQKLHIFSYRTITLINKGVNIMSSHPVDAFVGGRLRARRIMLGLSQETIGKSIGVTFQQIQKYERGINRMGSSRLYDFGKILTVPISYFFEGYELHSGEAYGGNVLTGLADDAEGFEHEKISSRETLELVRAYYSIKDEKVRKRFADLLKSMADQENQNETVIKKADVLTSA